MVDWEAHAKAQKILGAMLALHMLIILKIFLACHLRMYLVCQECPVQDFSTQLKVKNHKIADP